MLGDMSRVTGDTAPIHIRERLTAWSVGLELQVQHQPASQRTSEVLCSADAPMVSGRPLVAYIQQMFPRHP